MDWDESRGQQLLLLRVVVFAGVKQLINTNLSEREEMGALQECPGERCIWVNSLYFIQLFSLFNGTYLAEMVSVECQCCLRSQLEEMELCSENLLSSGNRGQIEPELHLFTAHCNGNDIIRDQNKLSLYVIIYRSQ